LLLCLLSLLLVEYQMLVLLRAVVVILTPGRQEG
jgi:hypothetical protein